MLIIALMLLAVLGGTNMNSVELEQLDRAIHDHDLATELLGVSSLDLD